MIYLIGSERLKRFIIAFYSEHVKFIVFTVRH